jgi:hypothetical protein
MARAIIRMKTGNKRVLLGFEESSESSEQEPEPLRNTKVPKVFFKPQQYEEGDDEDHRKAKDQRLTIGRNDTDDYLKMKIVEDETKQQKRLVHGEPTFTPARDDTITRLKTSLFGQMVADDLTDQVIRPLTNSPVKSKGLSIMEKMGFKVGEALGKDPSNSDAILEPIVMIPKSNKSGLGRGDNKPDIVINGGITEKDEESFKSRLQLEKDTERKERIVKKMQRLCLELTDQDIDFEKVLLKDLNVMWRGYVKDLQDSWKKKRLIHSEEEVEEIDNSQEDQENTDEELDMFEAEPIDTRIGRLYRHLRSEFDYCFWCGVRYEDQADLHANCPGETEEEHL